MLSSAAISRMFSGFGFQLALKALKSSSFKTLSGCEKPSLAFSGSFFEQPRE